MSIVQAIISQVLRKAVEKVYHLQLLAINTTVKVWLREQAKAARAYKHTVIDNRDNWIHQSLDHHFSVDPVEVQRQQETIDLAKEEEQSRRKEFLEWLRIIRDSRQYIDQSARH